MNEFNNYMRTKQRQALRKLLVELSIIAACIVLLISAYHIYVANQLVADECTQMGGYVHSSSKGYICVYQIELEND